MVLYNKGALELSSIEIGYIVSELNDTLKSYYVSSVHCVDMKSILFRLHHSLKPEKKLVVSAGRGIWITRYEISQGGTFGFLSSLRKTFERTKLLSLEQPGYERIVFINFEGKEGSRKLIAEFFGDGNLVVTDDKDRILELLRPLKVRHRELRKGGNYVLPPSRGMNPEMIRFEDLSPLRSSELEVARWMGRNVSFSKKYIDEVISKSDISSNIKGRDLDDEILQKLLDNIREITSLFKNGVLEPSVRYINGRPIDVLPVLFKNYDNVDLKQVSSFQEGVDEVFTSELLQERREKEDQSVNQKIREMEASIAQQQKARMELVDRIQTLRIIAKKLAEYYLIHESIEGSLSRLLVEFGADSADMKNALLTVNVKGCTLVLDKTSSLMGLSSQIYNIVKEMNFKLHAIESAEKALTMKKDELLKETEQSKIVFTEYKRQREKSWFERFRWFVTSEEMLAIGGRDASSNSAVIRKHTDDSDLVFHAELHGSPFFILKGGVNAKKSSIQETAQAVVCFSSAWKSCLHSGDAYWMRPAQVKKQAPSGMYLAKGSFIVEGSRNYLKNVEVKISVGIGIQKGSLLVISGPTEATRKHTLAYLTLIPDRVKSSDTAKQLKTELIRLLDTEIGNQVKRFSLDDFILALPSGGGKILCREKGDQKY